jgi:hypothetical protein
MKTTSKEVLFGARRAGVTYLFCFYSRAAFREAKAGAKRLGLSLSKLLAEHYFSGKSALPPATNKFTDKERKASTLEIQIAAIDDFSRRCLERQAAYRGCSVQDYMRDCILVQLQSDEDNSIFEPSSGVVILQHWDLGNYVGCHVESGAPKPPPSNFTRIPIPAGAIVETCA